MMQHIGEFIQLHVERNFASGIFLVVQGDFVAIVHVNVHAEFGLDWTRVHFSMFDLKILILFEMAVVG